MGGWLDFLLAFVAVCWLIIGAWFIVEALVELFLPEDEERWL